MAVNQAPLGAYTRGSANVIRIIYVQKIDIKFKIGSELFYLPAFRTLNILHLFFLIAGACEAIYHNS